MPNGVSDELDLCEIRKPVHICLLCTNPEYNFFTDASFITECLEGPKFSIRTALEPGYNPCFYIDFSNMDPILKHLAGN